MKLNQATDYAFRMVLHMSLLSPGEKVTGAVLAERELIPERFLLKIMRSLIAAGIMRSFRGVDGGFALNREPKNISLLDVIRAVEGDAYLQQCLYDMGSCSKSCKGRCAINEAMGIIQHQLIDQLEGVNFYQLAEREAAILQELRPLSQVQ
ncbi:MULTISPECIES: Rrf2 family transcriptional regulator [Veillonella]|uniref:RrF2 family transcriptional regulator n=1 Tax=Veillonella TaxID=29465 RepID=UPI0003E1E7D3|nr:MULTISPECIES: Rrf2 family transcriptional regulator [Veillonella]ETS92289.1 transcriptional regulator [Veillonella sp. AS16]